MSEHDGIDNPPHYDYSIKPLDAIESWGLGFALGSVVKYVARAGRKPGEAELKDLKKAQWCLNWQIERIEKGL